MKCVKCGNEIEDGMVVCSKCGEDYHFVPDFDPEIDLSIEETIKSISTEINKKDKKERIVKKSVYIALMITIFVGVITCAYFFVFTKSFFYLNREGKKAYSEARYEDALIYLQNASVLRPEDERIRLFICCCFYYLGDEKSFEQESLELYKSLELNTPVRGEVADIICAYYINNSKFDELRKLISEDTSFYVYDRYGKYIPSSPSFLTKPGCYTREAQIEIELQDNMTVYYMVVPTGTEPDETNMTEYTGPINLTVGEWTVYSKSKNNYGAFSDTVCSDYIVEVPEIKPPNLLVEKGKVYEPVMLTLADYGNSVYYTTDGTEPSCYSFLYEYPIPVMPGKSLYRFIAYDNGIYSNIVDAEFEMVLSNTISEEEAEKLVYSYTDSDEYNNFSYIYAFPAYVEGLGNCFIIEEYYTNSVGKQLPTGIHYGVNYDDGTVGRVIANDGSYEIVAR